MKKFLLFVLVVIVLVSCVSVRAKTCRECRLHHKAIRYITNIDDLNYIMHERINCPKCSWARDVKFR